MKRNLTASPPEVNGKLVVREEKAAFFVAWEEDPDDWLVRFDKDGAFPAREWADNMVRVFNRRLERCTPVPSTPPGMRPSSYRPGRVSP